VNVFTVSPGIHRCRFLGHQ